MNTGEIELQNEKMGTIQAEENKAKASNLKWSGLCNKKNWAMSCSKITFLVVAILLIVSIVVFFS